MTGEGAPELEEQVMSRAQFISVQQGEYCRGVSTPLSWLHAGARGRSSRRQRGDAGLSSAAGQRELEHRSRSQERNRGSTSSGRDDGEAGERAEVAELTGLLGLDRDWPEGVRVIVRRERPYPGAQLRFDDVDGYRLTAFAANTTKGQLADLEVRNRRRARCKDRRIRAAKGMGLGICP